MYNTHFTVDQKLTQQKQPKDMRHIVRMEYTVLKKKKWSGLGK